MYFFILLCIFQYLLSVTDVTLIGPIKVADGIGRISLGIIKSLDHQASIQVDYRNILDKEDLDPWMLSLIKPILQKSNIAIFTDPIFRAHEWPHYLSNIASIRIAYTMIECSSIPSPWVSLLNSYFDAIIVPDGYLQEVYSTSGVNVPIFVLPCPTHLGGFLDLPEKKYQNSPFIFGCSGTFIERKNHVLLLRAFAQEFSNSKEVKLILHGRKFVKEDTYNELLKTVEDLQLSNVEIISQTFTQEEYIAFMATLDCYVFISQGEGFSFTPREALARGIPVILSDNTVHHTLCRTGFFIPVPATKKIPAQYHHMPSLNNRCYFFDCTMQDVQNALKTVYDNYHFYLQKAQEGRIWVKKYLPENMRNFYLNIVKPKKVILGKNNRVTPDFLETNSINLYRKYISLK